MNESKSDLQNPKRDQTRPGNPVEDLFIHSSNVMNTMLENWIRFLFLKTGEDTFAKLRLQKNTDLVKSYFRDIVRSKIYFILLYDDCDMLDKNHMIDRRVSNQLGLPSIKVYPVLLSQYSEQALPLESVLVDESSQLKDIDTFHHNMYYNCNRGEIEEPIFQGVHFVVPDDFTQEFILLAGSLAKITRHSMQILNDNLIRMIMSASQTPSRATSNRHKITAHYRCLNSVINPILQALQKDESIGTINVYKRMRGSICFSLKGSYQCKNHDNTRLYHGVNILSQPPEVNIVYYDTNSLTDSEVDGYLVTNGTRGIIRLRSTLSDEEKERGKSALLKHLDTSRKPSTYFWSVSDDVEGQEQQELVEKDKPL